MITRLSIAAVLFVALGPPVGAHPFVAAGDEVVRSDLQLLADAGVLDIPLTTWPIQWPDVARALPDERAEATLGAAERAAVNRLRQQANSAARTGTAPFSYELYVADGYRDDRSFSAQPREDAGVQGSGAWLGERFAVGITVQAHADAQDGKDARLDGSYAASVLGNWVLSASALDRWWGPGYEGSLILSNNARPIPALTIERNTSTPFTSRWLRWIGPWRATAFVGQAEGSGVIVADSRLFGARVNFKPRPWMEIGLSRSAQWCGTGRPCDLQTFGKLLVGQDNSRTSQDIITEPGNQMAGYDLRVRSPWKGLPVAMFAQLIGEDEANGLPSRFLGLFGAETWMSVTDSLLRVRAEFADTACNFTRSPPLFGCAYFNPLYPQGYTYRGRTLGHTIGRDNRQISFAADLLRNSGASLGITLKRTEVNRAANPQIRVLFDERTVIDTRYARSFRSGRLQIGLGYDDSPSEFSESAGLRAFLSWSQSF